MSCAPTLSVLRHCGVFGGTNCSGGSEGLKGTKVDNIKPQVDPLASPVGHAVLASSRLLNLGYATDRPSFEMSCSFSDQVLAQLDILRNLMFSNAYKNVTYLSLKKLGVTVAKSHLPALNAELTVLARIKQFIQVSSPELLFHQRE